MKVIKKGDGKGGFTPRIIEITIDCLEELEALEDGSRLAAADIEVEVGQRNADILIALLENIYEETK